MAAWIFSLLVLLAPPERLASLPAYPGWAVLVAIAFHESGFAPDVDRLLVKG